MMAKKKVEPKEVEEKALVIVRESQALVILSSEDLEIADQYLVRLNESKKKIDSFFEKMVSSTRAAWKMALAEKAKLWDPVDAAATELKKRMADYKVKKRQEKQAEEDRLTQEAISLEEERRQQEAKDHPEEAEAILSAPIAVAPVILPDETKTDTRFATIWRAEVVDFDALIKAVAAGTVDNLALLPNEKFLREQATSFKDKLNIPGVRAFSKVV